MSDTPRSDDRDCALTQFRASVADPSPQWLAQTRNRLTSPDHRPPLFTFRRGLKWGSVAIAAGVVGALALGLLPVDENPTGSLRPDPASAAQLLRQAAANSDDVVQLSFTHDQFVYTRDHETRIGTVTVGANGEQIPPGDNTPGRELSYYEEVVTEIWRQVDSFTPARAQQTVLKRQALSPAGELKKAGIDLEYSDSEPQVLYDGEGKSGRVVALKGDDVVYDSELSDSPALREPFLNPTPATLASLPTNSEALAEAVRKYSKTHSESGSPTQMLGSIIDLLRAGDALLSPQLREALFLVAADLPNIQRFNQVDLEGRHGEALGMNQEGVRVEMIIDPEKAQVLGYRQIVVDGENAHPYDEGTVITSSSTSSSIVNLVGQTN